MSERAVTLEVVSRILRGTTPVIVMRLAATCPPGQYVRWTNPAGEVVAECFEGGVFEVECDSWDDDLVLSLTPCGDA